ncbi:MAG: hypothetical protein A2X40_01415 [Elusimicrobia bacterium GWC2_65_9]|nr:MAG: hypothetical protein A2X37_03665 [Elusimicrobia bacterium GWA2_66_18]OGR75162.1 MAG: hypothetical protein A2X40_01415 [Elusimicrobia bacterium GWC2_65_9]
MSLFSLVILTLNAAGPRRVHQGWPTRREAIVSHLKIEAADAAAFQEIWRSEDLEALAEGAGHPHRAHDAALGLAVTSRRPLVSARTLDCGGGYGALRARFLADGREADLYSTRLEEGEGPAAARRLGQLFRLAQLVRAESSTRPFALMGDLAAAPDDRETRLFLDMLEARDLCISHGDEVCGRTLGERRVDYLLIPYSSRPPRETARSAFTDPLPSEEESAALSSHFGLRARLDSSFPRLKLRTQPEGRAEALVETETILERARADAARRESSAGWLPWLGAQRAAAARDETARLSALIEEVRSAVIRAQRATASLAPS